MRRISFLKRSLVVLLLTSPAALPGQKAATSGESTSHKSTRAPVASQAVTQGDGGPTMQETKAWLERDATPMLFALEMRLDRSSAILSGFTHHPHDVTLSDCTLRWVSTDSMFVKSSVGSTEKVFENTDVVPLAKVDLNSVRPAELGADISRDEPVQYVRIRANASQGRALQQISAAGVASDAEEVWLYVRNLEYGERIAAAIRRAALLCGAARSAF